MARNPETFSPRVVQSQCLGWSKHHIRRRCLEPTPIQKGSATLKALGRGEMMTLALAYLESHMLACQLVGAVPPDHVSMEVLGDRVSQLTDDQLAALLMPISALGHSD